MCIPLYQDVSDRLKGLNNSPVMRNPQVFAI
jgi:hypothetical protein